MTVTYSFCLIKLWKIRESNTYSSNRVHDMLIHQLASVVIPSSVCAYKGTPLWADSWKTLWVGLFDCSGWKCLTVRAGIFFFHFNQPRILPPIGINCLSLSVLSLISASVITVSLDTNYTHWTPPHLTPVIIQQDMFVTQRCVWWSNRDISYRNHIFQMSSYIFATSCFQPCLAACSSAHFAAEAH